jgi:hypothetical protein
MASPEAAAKACLGQDILACGRAGDRLAAEERLLSLSRGS